MEPSHTEAVTSPNQAIPDPEAELRRYFEREAMSLLNTFRYYVVQAGIAQDQAVDNAAYELLSEVFIQALDHPGRFDASRPPRAWLRAIAANLIKRKQVEQRTQKWREPLVGDIYARAQESLSDGEVFDRLSALVSTNLEQAFETKEQAEAILALVSEEEQKVLRLAILLDLDGRALARELGIQAGAARVRLHRAVNHLRDAWKQQGNSK